MNLLVAVIAFAGACLAAIATVALVGRLRDEYKGWLIAWSVTAAALSVSLGVVGFGALAGFGATVFRIYQLTGSLLAPLWLAVGVVQLLARRSAAGFASWLAGVAFTVIASVIMLSDPVLRVEEFSTSVPLAGRHWDLPPTYVLWVTHVGVALALVAGLALAVVRGRGGDDYDADNMHALLALAPTGLAMLGAVSFTVPGMFTTLLLCVTAAAVWYVVLRPLAPYEDEEEDDEDPRSRPAVHRVPGEQPFRGDVQVAGRRVAPEEPGRRGRREEPPRPSGLGDLVAEYRSGERETDSTMRMGHVPARDDVFGGPATGTFMAGEYVMPPAGGPLGPGAGDLPGHPPETGQFAMPPAGWTTGEYDVPTNEYSRHAAPAAGGGGRLGGPATGEFAVPDPPYGAHRPMPAEEAFGAPPRPGARHRHGPEQGYGAAGQAPASPERGAPSAVPPETGALYPDAFAERPGGPGRPAPGIYGLLTVFTLLDGTGERFDRLAEETVDAVRHSEPDTLIYACHSVKSAPLQRIVYEIYRDETAYADHQRRPHVERFVTERQNLVLATNVIELDVNAAKVVPLPTVFGV
ncbi:hypothetical protein GCM10017673_52010 [Streptosporangium violaceochromogenes]|nr:hypothetical protein GCM10017673_52010 [Streptosporangium violaceochromogenes]